MTQKKVDLTTFVNSMFKDKSNWKLLTAEDKETNFFIFNRFMAKAYPKQAYSFNKRYLNKAICADIWFKFLTKERYTPSWFWKYRQPKMDENVKKYQSFLVENEISQKDLLYLHKYYPEILESEFDRFQKIQDLMNSK